MVEMSDSDGPVQDHLGSIVGELMRLRQGHGLARPSAVLQLSSRFRQTVLAGTEPADAADEATRVAATIRATVDQLDDHQGRYARVDFHLDDRHAYPTLTERQASLATELRCASKTVRRHADRSLESLALLLIGRSRAAAASLVQAEPMAVPQPRRTVDETWPAELRAFLHLPPGGRVDIVCSEIPPEERPAYAEPSDRNYLRYAKFADLDSLIYVRSRLAQTFPDLHIRDFSPSEYFDTSTDTCSYWADHRGTPSSATSRPSCRATSNRIRWAKMIRW